MRLAHKSVISWGALALLCAALSATCATTMSPAQRQRMSDCVAQCDRGREPPQSDPMGRDPYSHSTLSDCEAHCLGGK